jgi:Flp pilus assembly protein TadG
VKKDKGNRGQGLVEFALILPIFLLLLFGMVEFGRAYMTKNILTGAAREAVRLAAVQVDFPSADNAAQVRAQEVLTSAGIYGAVVTVTDNNVGDPSVVVTVTYNFPVLVGGFFGFTGPSNAIPLSSVTSMRRERY